MLGKYGINFIPDEDLYVKAAVKHMQIHLKNEYITNWETQVNNAPKCSILYKYIKVTMGSNSNILEGLDTINSSFLILSTLPLYHSYPGIIVSRPSSMFELLPIVIVVLF